MHRINIKTSREVSELFELSKQSLSELLNILSNLSSTSTDQILNEMNDSSSKYFQSTETITSTSTNRFFNLNSTNETLKAFENFDDSIEKIDFVSKKIDFEDEKSTQFSSNIASKNAREKIRKRKSDKSSI